MNFLNKKYPQLPKPSPWNKHGFNRFYFNKKEGNIDYTFYIDIRNGNKIILRQKEMCKWYSKFPSREEIINFLNEIGNQYVHFERPQFNRFKQSDVNLDLFKERKPQITRFLIGKIPSTVHVNLKLIKVQDLEKYDSLYTIANIIIKKLFENYNIIAFFKIQETDIYYNRKDNTIHLYILNQISTKMKIIKLLETAIKKKITLLNETFNEEIKSIEYALYIKSFFDAILYPIKFKFDTENFSPKKVIVYELFENYLYYYIDLDIEYEPESMEVISKAVKGKRVLGEDRSGKFRKYMLREITDCPINGHLKSKEYLENFIPWIRDQFFQAGKSKQKSENVEWTLEDLWRELSKIPLPKNDKIAIVTNISKYRAKELYFPASRLFISKSYIPSKAERAKDIQEVKKELLALLENVSKKIEKLNIPLEIVLLHEVIPKYYDLMEAPFIIQFAEGKEVELKRKKTNPYYLNLIPQELLKNDQGYKPIAGKFNFSIIFLLPDNMDDDEKLYFEKIQKSLFNNMKKYKLASTVEGLPSIKYTWNNKDIIQNKKNIWAQNFNNEIKPKLKEINEKIKETDKIVLVLLGLREIGTISMIFKREMENLFYDLLKKELSTLNFNIIQGIKYEKRELKKGEKKNNNGQKITEKTTKLPTLLYTAALENIARNNPNSQIAERIKNGILFTSKFPFGTADENHVEEAIDMIAGFDASKIEGVESTEPRGATIAMIDPYGRQIKTDFIENALTHTGVISEKAVRNLINKSIDIQDKILNESYKRKPVKVNKSSLDYFLYNNPNLPRRIFFFYDGRLLGKQVESFITIYKELKKTNSLMPDMYFFEVLKSHPLRNYLYNENIIKNVPFGTIVLLNNQEMLITKHIYPKKDPMVQARLYRFKMVIKQHSEQLISNIISEKVLYRIGLRLFQTAFFNTGKSGRPLKDSKVIHESHKLSKEFAEKPESIGILHYKE